MVEMEAEQIEKRTRNSRALEILTWPVGVFEIAAAVSDSSRTRWLNLVRRRESHTSLPAS